MKKFFLTVAAVFAFGFANAQDKTETTGPGFSQGDTFVSGSFGINSTNNKNTDVKTNGFSIAPSVGYFFTENIALGARIGYSTDKTKVSGTTTGDNSSLAAGIFGRYYFTPASKFSVFTELAAAYQTDKDKISDVKVNGVGVGLGLGLSYFVSDHFAIEANYAALTYTSAKADVSGADSVNSFNLGANLNSVNIGLTYKF